MSELFKVYRDKGRTIFLNSHLLSDMKHLCDRVALIDHGNILYTGRLASVFNDEHRVSRIFLDRGS